MKNTTLAIAAAGIVALGIGGVLAVNAEEGWRGGHGGHHGYSYQGDGRGPHGHGRHMRGAYHMNSGPHAGGSAHFAVFFDALDANADNEVSRQEALRPANQRFARLDGDGDGFVTVGELDAARQAEPGRYGEDMHGRLDADGDDRISAAEFAVRGRAVFARADANDDGVVSFAEFASLRRDRHRGGHGEYGHHGRGHHAMLDEAEEAAGSGDDD